MQSLLNQLFLETQKIRCWKKLMRFITRLLFNESILKTTVTQRHNKYTTEDISDMQVTSLLEDLEISSKRSS